MKGRFQKKHANRLLKLAEHIETLPTSRGDKPGFYFQTVAIKHECGTAGCAIGYMPVVWPKKFHYEDGGNGLVVYPNSANYEMRSGNIGLAREFFGLTIEESAALFLPEMTDVYGETEKIGLEPTYWGSSGPDIARNIRKFVEYKNQCPSPKSPSLG